MIEARNNQGMPDLRFQLEGVGPAPTKDQFTDGFLNRQRLSVGRLVGQWSMYVLNPTTYVAKGSGFALMGALGFVAAL